PPLDGVVTGGAWTDHAPPTPRDLPVEAGLLLHLSGDDYSDGDQWRDLSGGNHHAVKADGCNMPVAHQVADYNGRNFRVMRFDGKCGMILPDGLNLQKPFTAMIVDRYHGDVKGRTLQSRDNNWLLGKWSGEDGCHMEGWVGRQPAVHNVFTVNTVTLDQSGPAWRLDGALKGDAGGSAAPGKLGLCKGGRYKEVSEADIAAVLIWNRVLPDEERKTVETWLGERYGLPTPGAAPAPAKAPACLTLDGRGGHIRVNDHPDLRISEYTVEAWIHPEGPPNETWKGIVGKPGRNFNIWLNKNGFIHHRFRNSRGSNAGAPDTPRGAIKWDAWSHVAITNDGKTARTFVNGEEAASGPAGGAPLIDKTPLYIARNLDGGASQYFKGMVKEVRIWSRARARDEIKACMHRRELGVEPGLAAYWPLDEGEGNLAADRLVHENHGRVRGGARVEPETPIPLDEKNALRFDGKDDYIRLNKPLPVFAGSFTVSMWVKVPSDAPGRVGVLLGDYALPGGLGVNFEIDAKGRIRMYWSGDPDLSGKKDLRDDRWRFISFVRDKESNRVYGYVDGSVDLEHSGPIPDKEARIGHWIGRDKRTGDTAFQGDVSEIQIWSRARGRDEIESDMARRLNGGEEGLAGCWRPGDAAGDMVLDVAGLENHGAVKGPSRVLSGMPVPSRSHKALAFDGEDDRVHVPHSPGQASRHWTVEAWVNPRADGTGPWGRSIAGKAGSGGVFYRNIVIKDKKFHALYTDGNRENRFLSSPAEVSFNAWSHVAVRYDGAAMTLFINGSEAGRADVESLSPTTEAFDIGGRDNVGDEFFKGNITEVRFWNRARPRHEILKDLFVRLKGGEPGLAGYWPLGGGAAPLENKIRRPAPASIQGAASWKKCPIPVPLEIRKTPVAAFDGASDCISIPYAGALKSLAGPIAVEAWVKASGTGVDAWRHPVVSKHGAASGWELRCGGKRAEFMVTVNKVHYSARTEPELELNRWLHLTGVYDGGSILLYVNGVLKARKKIAGAVTTYPDKMNLGRNHYWKDRVFSGWIAEVRIWSGVRAAAEIHRDMRKRLTGREPGLAGYWKLDEEAGERAADSTPNGNHGVLKGVDRVESDPLPGEGAGMAPPDPGERIKALRRERDGLNKALKENKNRIEGLNSRIDGLNKRLAAQKKSNADSMAGLAEAQKAALAKKDEKINELDRLLIDEREKEECDATMAGLIENTNDQIAEARKRLLEKASDYRLGHVSMELKMIPKSGGVVMHFPKPENMAEGGSDMLSTINLRFDALEKKKEKEPVTVPAPDVIGCTETMAGRKLGEAGFIMEVHYQAVKKEGEKSLEGRVVNQHPESGAPVEPRGVVLVFIGKES
ncbi:MAG: hypothetical protein GY859_19735, partial [Desulfobacterales bacterium]|nr:hypothetical protein [Desulfobacterales bacterium]